MSSTKLNSLIDELFDFYVPLQPGGVNPTEVRHICEILSLNYQSIEKLMGNVESVTLEKLKELILAAQKDVLKAPASMAAHVFGLLDVDNIGYLTEDQFRVLINQTHIISSAEQDCNLLFELLWLELAEEITAKHNPMNPVVNTSQVDENTSETIEVITRATFMRWYVRNQL
ncbi:hypothetical protein PCE1_003735 [Barthelona sp. PCE]